MIITTTEWEPTYHTHLPGGLAVVALQRSLVNNSPALIALSLLQALRNIIVFLGLFQDPVADLLPLVFW